MLKTLRKLGQRAHRAINKEARDQYEAYQEELAIRRVLAKAIRNDPKKGAIMPGKVIGDKIVPDDKREIETDKMGLAFDPRQTIGLISVERETESSPSEAGIIENFFTRQRKGSGAKFENPDEVDPYTDLSWIDDSR